jgi:uncharacterized membrane protein
MVTVKLLDIIALVGPHVHRDDDRQALSWQAGMIQQGSLDGLPVEQDRQRVEQAHQAALKALRMTTAMPVNPADKKTSISP